jgi:hypothetical protein
MAQSLPWKLAMAGEDHPCLQQPAEAHTQPSGQPRPILKLTRQTALRNVAIVQIWLWPGQNGDPNKSVSGDLLQQTNPRPTPRFSPFGPRHEHDCQYAETEVYCDFKPSSSVYLELIYFSISRVHWFRTMPDIDAPTSPHLPPLFVMQDHQVDYSGG